MCEAMLAPILLHGLMMLLSCVDEARRGEAVIPVWGVDVPQALVIFFYMMSSVWILSWVHALYQFMVAFAIAEYYYTPYDMDDEKDVGCCTVWDGLFIGVVFHSGSLACGSLLIILLKPLKWLAVCANFAWREASATGNEVITCIMSCCSKTAQCWKATLSFVNKNAYIDMVVTSHSFCDSAKNARQMIMSLGGSVAALNGATDLLATFGTAIIVMATAYVISARGALSEEDSSIRVTDPVAVMAVSMLVALRVASCFMSIFDVASDTLLYCYGLDLQSGKGCHTAPAALKQLVHAHESALE
uniref:Choline transporter-like protein n=1 Tax=Alexandrium andersonii TaxID=327968 RepID=A0A7S2J204_9DINO